ncbi:diphthine synthase [Candidatus Bathyarchaeota archaeon]|nr:MAG: diphthine synthase [Candidatus Bathyarchaeota archaeon]
MTLIGLGLHDEKDISLKGLEEARKADIIFLEQYTSLMAGFSLGNLEKIIGKKVIVVDRKEMEDKCGRVILENAKERSVALMVPGDPLIATTHIDLRIRAEKMGIKTRVIHAASIISAAIGLSGLQNYRFGRSVTIPFPEGITYETPYLVIRENRERNLHTLCFLDVKAEESRFMTIREGLEAMLKVEEKMKGRVVTPKTLVVGIARAGSSESVVRSGFIEELLHYDFGPPPHIIIFTAETLHFMEAEALITLTGAPPEIRRMVK